MGKPSSECDVVGECLPERLCVCGGNPTVMSRERQIVVRLMHGLGNQLFQYALGRRLAIERGASVHFDAFWYSEKTCPRPDRPLALCEFDIRGEITFDDRWKDRWLPPTLSRKIRWVIDQRLLPRWRRNFVEEDLDRMKIRGDAFDRRILGAPDGAYFCGYWVSPRYFDGIEYQLRSELVLRAQPKGRYPDYRARMQESESVAIHVRRGDYLTYTDFGILSAAYYRRAVAAMRARIKTPRFFVFSDDVDEARDLMDDIVECEHVELEPGASPAHDLSLMASCRHFINANSTFSWWGAWLSPHREKIVFVPDKWLLGIGRSVDNIYLPGWETVSIG